VADRYVLAIDQGTSATKCLLIGPGATVVRRAAAPLDCAYPQPGWVEQDPGQVWLSVARAVRECCTALSPGDITAIGLSTQRESVLLWDRVTGQAVSPLLGWQDQRALADATRLLEAGHAEFVRCRSGLPLDPMFSALKAAWLLRRYRDQHGRDPDETVALGTVDSWLLARLCGGQLTSRPVIEAGNASRTQLMDVQRRRWDADLLQLFGVPDTVMPSIVPSAGEFGQVTALAGLDGTPVTAVLGDSHAALYAHRPLAPGTVKATYGTGSSVMALTELAPAGDSPAVPVDQGLGLTLAWQTDQTAWALEGNIRSAGATLSWLSRATGVAAARLAELGGMVSDPGIHLVPAFTGLGAPWWNTAARGTISGLTFGTGLPELARAALESTAFQVADVVAAIERSGVAVRQLVVDGGASASDTLMQFQADLCGVPVVRPALLELSALGAAWLAAEAAGLSSQPPTEGVAAITYRPQLSEQRRQDRIDRWREAVAAATPPSRGDAGFKPPVTAPSADQ
jgi:glycerol kinase